MTKIWLKLNGILVKRLTKAKSKFAVKINMDLVWVSKIKKKKKGFERITSLNVIIT